MLDKIRADWVEELGINISDGTWDGALNRVNGSTSSARLGLIQFKVLDQIHYSRVRLSYILMSVKHVNSLISLRLTWPICSGPVIQWFSGVNAQSK